MKLTDTDDITFMGMKLLSLWLISWFAKNYHEIMGNVMITLSVAYLAWKWYRDWKKAKA